MMDFDQMMDAWKAQDDKPLYGVNRDLLQLLLQHEQARIRRMLRRDQWVAYTVGTGMAVFGGVWLWMLISIQGPVLQTVLAGAATGVLAMWVGAFWLSRRRQTLRERGFGNTLQEEVRRNLSLVEYQLSNGASWGSALLWKAPVLTGAGLIYWLSIEVNLDPGESRWEHAWMIAFLVPAVVLIAYASRDVKKKLESRQRRLRELLETLNAGE